MGLKSLDSSVSIVTRLRDGIPMFRVSILGRVKRLLSVPKRHELLWCPFSPLLRRGGGVFIPGIKR